MIFHFFFSWVKLFIILSHLNAVGQYKDVDSLKVFFNYHLDILLGSGKTLVNHESHGHENQLLFFMIKNCQTTYRNGVSSNALIDINNTWYLKYNGSYFFTNFILVSCHCICPILFSVIAIMSKLRVFFRRFSFLTYCLKPIRKERINCNNKTDE